MADGYSRVTGRVGVCAVVPGPGVLNAAAGLATAYACGSRVLCVVGQVATADLGRGRGVLHEIPDQQAMLRGVLGRSEYATCPEDIPGLVDAVFAALEGNERPRPHALEVGWDTMLRRAPATWADKPDPPGPKQPDLSLIDEVADVLTRGDAARDPRRRRGPRWWPRAGRPRGAARRPRRHDDRGQGRDSREPPARAAAARGSAIVRRGRRAPDHRLTRPPVARTAGGAARCHRDPHRRRSGRARPEREARDRDRGRCSRSRARLARGGGGRHSSSSQRGRRTHRGGTRARRNAARTASRLGSQTSGRVASSCAPRSPSTGCSSTR